MGTDESTDREGQEDLPVSEEKTEKNRKREMEEAEVREVAGKLEAYSIQVKGKTAVKGS